MVVTNGIDSPNYKMRSGIYRIKEAISEAITAKGGTVSTGDGFEDFPADIASIPSGGGGGSGDASKPVRFMDYDGSIVASYTPEEFAELTEMPANPSHDGLTAQGWNWSIVGIQVRYKSPKFFNLYL